MPLGEKQWMLMRAKLPRMTILQGAISAGKTFVGNHKAMRHIIDNYEEQGLILFAGRTLKSLERNVLLPLADMLGGMFTYSLTQKTAYLCGRRIELEGCNDADAEAKIRGSTLWFVYGDELTLWNEAFLTRCMGGLRAPGACFLGTTNPDAPTHFLKTAFLDRAGELGLWSLHFTMEDNPCLSEEYRRQVEKEYTGVFHDRLIKGLWTRAEGTIYMDFAAEPGRFLTRAPAYDFIQVGVDFGGSKSAFAFVAAGLCEDCSALTALASERHTAAGVGPEEMYRLLERFLARVEGRYGPVALVYADNAEQTLINGLAARLRVPLRGSRKLPVMDRVRAVCALSAQGRFFYTADCESLKSALCGAVYDHRQFKDTRLDDGSSDIDTLDAFEYAFERYIRGYMAFGARDDGGRADVE